MLVPINRTLLLCFEDISAKKYEDVPGSTKKYRSTPVQADIGGFQETLAESPIRTVDKTSFESLNHRIDAKISQTDRKNLNPLILKIKDSSIYV
jgi:hypothetical protein